MALVDQIDEGLKRCYELNKEKYDGAFKQRCEDNGFDDDDAINEEMGTSVEESQLADEDFLEGLCPWIESEGDERREEIFAILKKCLQDPKAYTNAAEARPLRVDDKAFAVTKQDIEKARQLVLEQAPSICEGGFANDGSLMIMLAVTMKMGNNYLQYLVDMFTREKLYIQYRSKHGDDKKEYKEVDFQQKNHHMAKVLKNISPGKIQSVPKDIKSVLELASAAIKSFLHRVAPKLMLTPHDLIKFDLRKVAQYIEQTVTFVHVQSKVHGTCPFQYESVFAFKESVKADSEEGPEDDDDDEEDDQNPDEDDAKDGGSQSKLPDIKKSLTTTKLAFKSKEWGIESRNNRPLGEAFAELKDSAAEKEFPQFNRFCSVLDLRNYPGTEQKADDKDKEADDKDKEADGKHNLFVFQPEKDSRKIHKKASALNYFHNARKSIIPCDPNPESVEPVPVLHSMTLGPQITLSFHVEAEDNIRCYLFIHGQFARFFPEDLKLLLPLFFDPSEDNKTFVESDEMDEIIETMKGMLRDDQFQQFLEENQVVSPYEKELKEKGPSKKKQTATAAQ